MTYYSRKDSRGGFSGCVHVEGVSLCLVGSEPEKFLAYTPSFTTRHFQEKLVFPLWENSLQPLEPLRFASFSIDYYPDFIFALDCVLKPCTRMSTPCPWTHVALGNTKVVSVVSKPTICSTLSSDCGSACLPFCLMVAPFEPVTCSWVRDSTAKLLPPVVPRPTRITPNNLGAYLGPAIFPLCSLGVWEGKEVYYLTPVPGKGARQVSFNHASGTIAL